MKKVVWSRLKDLLCPKCKTMLDHDRVRCVYECPSGKCNFRISDVRFNQVITNLYKANRETYDE